MNAEVRVRHAIGDLVVQLQVALARNEELEAENKKLKERQETKAE